MDVDNKTKRIINYVQGLFDKEIFLVGGSVRDLIMGNTPKDYDFCSSMSTEKMKEKLKGKHKTYGIGEKFGTILFRPEIDGETIEIEITRFRKDEKYGKTRKPEVTFCDDLLEDLKRRDFTINSLALSAKTLKIYDPFNGKEDIEKRILKTAGNSKIRFKEDPLRILRGIRFATKYNLNIEEKTLKSMRKQAFSLLRISKERWVMELDKILSNNNVFLGLWYLWHLDIFSYVIPELQIQEGYNQNSMYHDYELWEHTARAVESAQKEGEPIEILWSLLLHDIAKPFCRTDNIRSSKDNEFAKKAIEYFKNDEDLKSRFVEGDLLFTSHYLHHEKIGAEMASKICDYLKFSKDRKKRIVETIRNHLKDDCPIKKYDDEAKGELSKEMERLFLK